MKRWNVASPDIGKHPLDCHIRNRIGRRRNCPAEPEARRRVKRRDLAGNRTEHHQYRVDSARNDDLIDLDVRLAEDAHRVPGGFEGTFGGLLIGDRLL